MNSEILAVVVTYNRLELLKRCIKHLQLQTLMPDILVINNGSTDGTETYLTQANIDFVTQANLGSAGGWSRANEEGWKRNYRYVWLMDDDGFPDARALELLRGEARDDVACISSVVVKENKRDEFVFGFPALNDQALPIILGPKRSYHSFKELPSGETYPFCHFFNGALLSLKHARLIENINQAYFMYGDEVDYYCRLKNVGKISTLLSAFHYHPDVSHRVIEKKRIYYFIRNSIIIYRKYYDHSWIRIFLMIGATGVRLLRRNGFIDALGYVFGVNAKYLYRGIYDGIRSNFNNRY